MGNYDNNLVNINRFGKNLLFSPSILSQFSVMEERTRRKFDNIFLVTGMEGTGKSLGIAIPTAFYLSGKNIKVVFTWEQFEKYYKSMPEGSTIVWDEFIFAGMSTDALSEMQKRIIQLMVTGRKKLINVILVVPTIFLLKNYFAVHRALCLIHTDSPDFLSRGTAYFYGYDNKRILYNRHKKIQYTDLKLSTFSFKFVDQSEQLYDMKLYDKMKDEAIASIGEEKKDTQSNRNKKKTNIIITAIKYLHDSEGMKFKEISEILKMGKDDVRHYYNMKEEEEKKKNPDENIVEECEKDSLKEGLVFNTELDSTDEVEDE